LGYHSADRWLRF